MPRPSLTRKVLNILNPTETNSPGVPPQNNPQSLVAPQRRDSGGGALGGGTVQGPAPSRSSSGSKVTQGGF